MKTKINLMVQASIIAVVLLSCGCGKRPPVMTAAEGTVYFLGQPLPNVQVQFVPMLEGFGAEFNSIGVTDENGHFTLTCGGEPGAAVARHKVLVLEGPVPAEARGQSEEAQTTLTKYMSKLKNRPIPTRYATVSQTPLELEVTTGKTNYDLTLER